MRRFGLRLGFLALGAVAASAASAAEMEKTRLRTTDRSTLQGALVTQDAGKTGDIVVVCEFFDAEGRSEFAKTTVSALGPGEKDVAELRVPGVWTATKCAAVDAERALAAERAALAETLRRLIAEAGEE